jgi:rubrerythrin
MRSKSGIYESYLAIAQVAEKRGNHTIAAHFYQYAQEYLDANPHLQHYEQKEQEKKETVSAGIQEIKVNEKIIDIHGVTEKTTETASGIKATTVKETYDKIVLQALALCMNEEFDASYKLFSKARELENCNCFETDFRVELMLTKLKTFLE